MTLSRSDRPVAWDRAIAAAMAVFLLLYSFGPVRVHPNRAILDLTWPRALMVLGLLVAIRHVRRPSPWIGAAIVRRVRARLVPDGDRFVLTTALASRVAVLAVGLAMAITYPLPSDHPGHTQDPIWNVASRWDAFWYLNIENVGYHWDATSEDQFNVAFFPAFPVVMRVAGSVLTMPLHLTGRQSWSGESANSRLQVAGLAISVAAFLWGLAVMYELARSDIGDDRAKWAVTLLAYFPFAVFFSAPYTEGLFLLSVTSAFLAARQERPVAIFLWGALAALTRPTGLLVSVPLAAIALAPLWPRVLGGQADRSRRFRPALLLAAAGPVVGLGLHMIHLWSRVGDPLAWVKAQQGWQHSNMAYAFVMERWRGVADLGLWGYLMDQPGRAIGTIVPVLALALLGRMWRLSPAYAAFVLVTLAPAVAIATPSIGRIGAPLFPMFIALAAALPATRVSILVVMAFGAVQLWGASLYFRWLAFF